ncbi:hypothetical protein WAI453_004858 [Rhynchosporium graminicola]|uniref:Uncharacterized protein n=1 Tax=Rhynchosporium graminicola TaxID=2792576 RepID=A0A1E1LQP9_9HELO|nr:uncharacterized protein RCO7_10365 [Rhynchosporium commune]
MRFTPSVVGVLALASGAVAVEMAVDEALAESFYDSGLAMDQMMSAKLAHWEMEEKMGIMAQGFPAWSKKVTCANGIANAMPGVPGHQFKCRNMDLYSFVPMADLGCPNAMGSGSWGWTDEKSGREFVAAGCYYGTSFLEILPTGQLVKLGFLTSYAAFGSGSRWKELRGYKNYMVIGSELNDHGVQIFDMTKLLTVNPASPVIFDGTNATTSDLTSHVQPSIFGRSHNVHVHNSLPYFVTVGMGPRLQNETNCFSGIIFWDVTDISNPKHVGCAGEDGYVHDIQCLIYKGPDTKYVGTDVCYGYNEDSLTIYNVTDKANAKIISRTSYTGASYTHQGEVLDKEWQQYLILDDETDEVNSRGPAADKYPVTYVWDISSLEAPKQTGLYKGTTTTIDHNQYVIGDHVYQSNYGSGLRVYDISSIPSNSKGTDVCEVAYIDILPEDDNLPGGGNVTYSGTWSHYPYFKSGFVFIHTIERGAFVAKASQAFPKCQKSCSADNCLRGLRSADKLAESQAFCGEFTKTVSVNVTAVAAKAPYVAAACAGNVISRVSSACACLPTA